MSFAVAASQTKGYVIIGLTGLHRLTPMALGAGLVTKKHMPRSAIIAMNKAAMLAVSERKVCES